MTTWIYLAAPFFSKEQVDLCQRLEALARELGVDLYSPRLDGVLQDMTPEEKKAAKRGLFEKNVSMIGSADVVLAVIDGRDTGVVWEMGFAYGMSVPIVTYTEHDYGLNVMISESVEAHCRSWDALRSVIEAFRDMPPPARKTFLEAHRQFDPRVH